MLAEGPEALREVRIHLPDVILTEVIAADVGELPRGGHEELRPLRGREPEVLAVLLMN